MESKSMHTAALVLMLALARPAAAQDEVPTFGEAVEVNVVNLAVYVTRGDEPVTDLTREDFEIFEDGELVPLSNFYVSQPRRARPGLARPPAGRREVAPEAAPVAPPEAETPRPLDPLFLVAYVDNMNLRPHTRKMVIERLETFVEGQLAPEDQVMIVTADHRLRIRQEFSRDRDATRRALVKLIREPALGVQEDLALSSILNEVTHRYTDPLAGELDAARIEGDFDILEERLIGQARGSLGLLGDLVGSLGELPGRKMVFHVSDGISAAASRAEMGQLLARANANQVSFYTIDGGGSRQFGTSMAGQSGNLGDFWTPEIARNREDTRAQSLIELADATGGKMMLARKNMDRELDGFRDAVSHYYSLGFTPRQEGSDVRQIRVKVRRRGVDVRYPQSYRLRTSEEQLYERVLTALRLGVAVNELDLEIDFGGASLRQGAVVLPIMVRLPIDRLVLMPHEGRRVGSVTLMYGMLDGEGRASEIRLGHLPISIPEDRLKEVSGKEVGYEVTVAVAPDARRLAVAARDDVGRTMAAIKREIKLIDGAPRDSGLRGPASRPDSLGPAPP